MSVLEQSIRDICATHNLHSFQVGLLLPNDKRGMGWSVYLQRWEDDKPVGSWSGDGKSISEALQAAIDRLPHSAELADEAITLGEAA